ncbi:MAG: hypothetical protein M3P44_05440 [Actinomycetota bacterium]|nr:hypothetical protein [Actinomycetota bacterium]
MLIRHHGRTQLTRLDRLWSRLEAQDGSDDGIVEPHALEILSWSPDHAEPLFLPVMLATRRDHDGDLVELRTKMGRRVRCTPDHPWFVSAGHGGGPTVKLAAELTTADWLPLATERTRELTPAGVTSLLAAADAAELSPEQLIVHPARGEVSLRDATISTTKNGSHPTTQISLDERFWRVVGLYLAEGHTTNRAGDGARISWSFNLQTEQHLVDEVCAFWLAHNVTAHPRRAATAHTVTVRSRLLGTWWTQVLGLGRTSYEQRLPDLIWDRPPADKWALLSGLFEGDGSWSLVRGGPSAIIEMGTVSDELADGVLRLLADLGIVASRRIGPTAKSTQDTHWIRISGAAQIERAIALVPERDRPGILAGCQSKRIAPTGYRGFGDGTAWARIVGTDRVPHAGPVYSFEVAGTHAFVTSGGLVTHNCFPKDVNALKQLAGNSGYHFQLLNAVIEVNELQKRRVIGKLEKHLGTLVGKTVALLGLAFKPNTDDMREATSLVLSARLQAAGASVRAYDPIAEEEARHLMPGIAFADGALGAVAGADAVVLVTEWDEFKTLDWHAVAGAMQGTLLIDGRNALDADAVRGAGLTYEGIGT